MKEIGIIKLLNSRRTSTPSKPIHNSPIDNLRVRVSDSLVGFQPVPLWCMLALVVQLQNLDCLVDSSMRLELAQRRRSARPALPGHGAAPVASALARSLLVTL